MPGVAKASPHEQPAPVRVFCSVSAADRPRLETLFQHLSSIRRAGIVSVFHRWNIIPGDDADRAISVEFARAEIVLLLLSRHFFSDEECMSLAEGLLGKPELERPRIIPILLSEVDYRRLPLYGLRRLPDRAVTAYAGNEDQAWLQIARGIADAAEAVQAKRSAVVFAPHAAGTVLRCVSGNSYRLQRELGRGGYGTVYLADLIDHLGATREVAIKLVADMWSAGPAPSWVQNEIQSLYKLSHKNIVQVFQSDTCFLDGGRTRPLIAMEHLRGRTLEEAIRQEPLQLRGILHILGQVCEGVEFAHGRGIIHRDLKPANIMLCGDGPDYIVKILDFGLSKARPTSTDQPSGYIGGTPGYQSPEQAHNAVVDGRSDIYSIGCTLHRLLVGEPPGLEAFGDISASLIDRIPLRVHQLCRRATARHPMDRQQSVLELRNALVAIWRGLSEEEAQLLCPLQSAPHGDADTVLTLAEPTWMEPGGRSDQSMTAAWKERDGASQTSEPAEVASAGQPAGTPIAPLPQTEACPPTERSDEPSAKPPQRGSLSIGRLVPMALLGVLGLCLLVVSIHLRRERAAQKQDASEIADLLKQQNFIVVRQKCQGVLKRWPELREALADGCEKARLEQEKAEKAATQKLTQAKPAPEQKAAQKSAPEKPAPEKAVAQKLAPEKPAPEKAVAQKSAPEKPAPEKAAAQKPAPEKLEREKTTTQKLAVEKPVLEKAAARRTAPEKPVSEKAAVQKPALEQPPPEKLTAQNAVPENAAPEKPPLENDRLETAVREQPLNVIPSPNSQSKKSHTELFNDVIKACSSAEDAESREKAKLAYQQITDSNSREALRKKCRFSGIILDE